MACNIGLTISGRNVDKINRIRADIYSWVGKILSTELIVTIVLDNAFDEKKIKNIAVQMIQKKMI